MTLFVACIDQLRAPWDRSAGDLLRRRFGLFLAANGWGRLRIDRPGDPRRGFRDAGDDAPDLPDEKFSEEVVDLSAAPKIESHCCDLRHVSLPHQIPSRQPPPHRKGASGPR